MCIGTYTLTKTGDGNVTLTATVTSPTCSNITSPTKTIAVGNYFPQGTTYATSNYSYYSGTLLSSYSFFLPANEWGYASFNITDANYSSLLWTPISVPSGSATWSYSGTGNSQLTINIKAIGSAYNTNTCTIRLSAQGPCGSYTQDFSASAVVRGWSFMVSPNPASTELTR